MQWAAIVMRYAQRQVKLSTRPSEGQILRSWFERECGEEGGCRVREERSSHRECALDGAVFSRV